MRRKSSTTRARGIARSARTTCSPRTSSRSKLSRAACSAKSMVTPHVPFTKGRPRPQAHLAARSPHPHRRRSSRPARLRDRGSLVGSGEQRAQEVADPVLGDECIDSSPGAGNAGESNGTKRAVRTGGWAPGTSSQGRDRPVRWSGCGISRGSGGEGRPGRVGGGRRTGLQSSRAGRGGGGGVCGSAAAGGSAGGALGVGRRSS